MFTIYSKPSCPHCDMAKALLNSQGIEYFETILDIGQPKLEGVDYISRDELLAKIPTARTMPQVVFKDKVIGGYADLKGYLVQAA